jgi:ERF superfamily
VTIDQDLPVVEAITRQMRDVVTPGLAAALVGFQSEVAAIPKNRTAIIPTKSGKSYSYRYADLADTWAAIRVPLRNNGLAVTQKLSGGRDGWMGLTTTVWHTSGETDSDTVDVPIKDRTPQEIGSQITYYKRYTLSALLGIATEDDDDGASASARRDEPFVEAANMARGVLLAETEQFGWNPDTLVAEYEKRNSEDLLTTTDVAKIKEFTADLVREAGVREPGSPAETAPAVDPPITKQLSRQLHTLFSVNKITGREAYLQWCSDALGFEVATTDDLTTPEALKLIGKLKELEKQSKQEITGDNDQTESS